MFKRSEHLAGLIQDHVTQQKIWAFPKSAFSERDNYEPWSNAVDDNPGFPVVQQNFRECFFLK